LADVPEKADQRDGRTADDRRTAGHEHAELAGRREVRAGRIGAGTHDLGDDQRAHAQDEAYRHPRAHDGARLVNAGKARPGLKKGKRDPPCLCSCKYVLTNTEKACKVIITCPLHRKLHGAV
jgi:hypothetical protein